MKKYCKFFVFVFILAAISFGCSNSDNKINTDMIEETDDLQTLIETNEHLVQLINEKEKEIEALEKKIEELETENMEIKNDILTYKQQIYEVEDQIVEERALRNELDEKAMHLFEAMNEKNHALLMDLVSNNVKVMGDEEVFEITNEQGKQTFPYVNLSNVHYVRQGNYEYKRDEETFTSEYIFYTGGVKEPFREESVFLTFKKDEEWKLTQISYLP